MRALEAAGENESEDYQTIVGLFYQTHVCRADPWPANVNDSIGYLSKSPAYKYMNGPNEFTITGTMKNWDRRADLPKITVPTFIVTGQYDEVDLDCHLTIQNGIKGSNLLSFGDCSHLIMNEKPDSYNHALRVFMDA